MRKTLLKWGAALLAVLMLAVMVAVPAQAAVGDFVEEEEAPKVQVKMHPGTEMIPNNIAASIVGVSDADYKAYPTEVFASYNAELVYPGVDADGFKDNVNVVGRALNNGIKASWSVDCGVPYAHVWVLRQNNTPGLGYGQWEKVAAVDANKKGIATVTVVFKSLAPYTEDKTPILFVRQATTKTESLYPPAITMQPQNVTAKVGDTAYFAVQASRANSYYWEYRTSGSDSWKNVNVTSARTPNLNFAVTASQDGYQYRCKVTNGNGSTYTNVVTLTVDTGKPVISTQPVAVTVDAGQTATFKVTATRATSYQWQYRASSTGSWTNVKPASGKTATFTLTAQNAYNGYQYRCAVTNDAGTVYSNAVTLTVRAVKPSITTQPKAATVTAGDKATFTVKATGATSYQWQYRTSSTGSWKSMTSYSSRTATVKFKTSTAHNGFQYRCKLTNSAGTVYSKAVTLTVQAVKPTVTTQPKAATVKAGNTATFTVKATGAASYQWQYKTPSGSWKSMTSYSSRTATVKFKTAESYNGFQYRCKLTNSAGTVYSRAVTLTVVK